MGVPFNFDLEGRAVTEEAVPIEVTEEIDGRADAGLPGMRIEGI